ncbi:MAG: hypothetical protein K5989_05635, partial [Lachnospiraceae bacterium]|nr:hypothetical protein [Lachnospiraceae bacterium]
MKALSHDFTLREKVIILVLIIFILILAYYQFFYKKIRYDLDTAAAEKEALMLELQKVDTDLNVLRTMQKELDEVKAGESVGQMYSYNAEQQERACLSEVLAGIAKYNFTFSPVTREGNQIRRNCTMSFTVNSYNRALEVLTDLSKARCRNLISNVQFSSP